MRHLWLLCLAAAACGFPELPKLTGDAAVDAAVDAPACTAATDHATDPFHCGRCDHSCGGASCVQGECQPQELARDIPGLREIAIANDAVYWSELTRIASCPLPQGCVLAPRGVADPFDRLGLLTVQGDQLFFTGCTAGSDSCDDRQRLFQCPTSGCPLGPPTPMFTDFEFRQLVAGGGQLYLLDSKPAVHGCATADCGATDAQYQVAAFGAEMLGLALDGETLYVDVAGQLRTCPAATGCATPASLAGTDSIEPPFAIHGGVAYWTVLTGPGRRIVSCTLASCTSAPFGNEVLGISELAADDTGLYWINSMAGTIRHCPPSGCPAGGAAHVARNLTGAENLTLGPGFVYYTAGGAIYKVAKP